MDGKLYPHRPVLVVDDEPGLRRTLRAVLAAEGITNVAECADGMEADAEIRQHSFSAVILDLRMPGKSGLDVLDTILENRPGTSVIVATASDDLETAIRCMRAGAFDYIPKPIDRTRLVTSLRHAIEKWESRQEVQLLQKAVFSSEIEHPEAFDQIVTRDPAVLAVFRYVESVAPTILPVLITGETGVGKELVARALHSLSGRDGPFVSVNVAGLDDTLFADTLFGHVKGAYTGADGAREGMVARAEGGTLFLDEIGDLAPQSQVKLLRLLQEGEYYPLGSDRSRKTSARCVFATNLDLSRATAEGRFRKDLMFRLGSHEIRVPPLRERRGDIEILVDHFLDRASAEIGKTRPTVPDQLLSLLRNYSFPGNIRELEGMIKDALVRNKSSAMRLESFRGVLSEGLLDGEPGRELQQNAFTSLETLPSLRSANRQLLEEALRRADGNQGIAARLIGLSRSALNRRLGRSL